MKLIVLTVFFIVISVALSEVIVTKSDCEGNFCQFCLMVDLPALNPVDVCTTMRLDTCEDPVLVDSVFYVNEEEVASGHFQMVDPTVFEIDIPFVECTAVFTVTDLQVNEDDIGFLLSAGGHCDLPIIGELVLGEVKLDYVHIPVEKCESLELVNFMIVVSVVGVSCVAFLVFIILHFSKFNSPEHF